MKLNVFDDVVNAGLIQAYKPVYRKSDVDRLSKSHTLEEARWIIICSAAYHWKNGKECRVTRAAK